MSPAQRLACGIRAVPGVSKTFAATQAAYRFFNNPRVALRTLAEPIVWVLHAAYVWLPIGLALKAIHLGTGAAWAFQWQHALTVGAAATMILGVTTRAALGHTGRPLIVSRGIGIAYVLLLLAALVRVFGPALLPASYIATIETAAILWIVAFTIYLVIYAPILTLARVDQKPG